MSKIFSKNQGPAVDVKRNTFDLSFASHITGKIGDLIPCFCQEVIPGDSFEIDPKFGLRFNPTVFPIQTKVHGIMHFFYVRNRNLYSDWTEYITRTKDDAVMPYLSINEDDAKDIIGTGSIGDYLGVPTTLTGDYAKKLNIRLDTILGVSGYVERSVSVEDGPAALDLSTFGNTPLSLVNRKSPSYVYIGKDTFDSLAIETWMPFNPFVRNYRISNTEDPSYDSPSWKKLYGYFGVNQLNHPLENSTITLVGGVNLGSEDISLSTGAYLLVNIGQDTDSPLSRTQNLAVLSLSLTYENGVLTAAFTDEDIEKKLEVVNSKIGTNSVYIGLVFDPAVDGSANFQTLPNVVSTDPLFKSAADSITFDVSGIQVLDATDPNTVVNNPFVKHIGESVPKIKLNALPFRAYESIYNCFYRDETVDPFILNGKEVYNDFITTHSGGADITKYHLYQKNWERDYYTSCQTSPQQGVAPLVGISANGTFTFNDGTNEYTATTTIGDDGETITGITTYSPDMPKGNLRQLMDVVTNGISINDLRNVNSFQKWKESNIRRGYKYVNQIYSHFGVNPSFKANDMPEFIGGVHSVGDVNQVTNMTADGLGDYAGQLTMFGGSDNKVHCYCDEHGYIIGILSVFPEPVYSQMLPKHFLKTETPLDYFFPEFNHIGMQPITYNEVTPLEVAVSDAAAGTDTLNDTFGYQRAWADYLANNDQSHADFRTSLSECVMSRVFNNKPELGHDFISINSNDINDVFVTTDDSDKMLGELRFDVKAKRPIPMFGIPRIE